jgi:hypothetical protein
LQPGIRSILADQNNGELRSISAIVAEILPIWQPTASERATARSSPSADNRCTAEIREIGLSAARWRLPVWAPFRLFSQDLSAQDVAITNARVIVGNGTVIDSGTVIVRGGKIVSVAAGGANTQGLKTIDAKGMSAMPGFIDGHRHINTGPNEKAQMQALLEAGYTTVLSGGGPAEGNITLRDHIDKGVINGPRVIPSGSLRLNNHTPESARAEIRKMAAMGVKFTGEIALTPVPGPPRKN